jgi:hypothetical protein
MIHTTAAKLGCRLGPSQALLGAAALHLRAFAGGAGSSGSDSSDDSSELAAGAPQAPAYYDAAEAGAPLAVHQLIGDPRTGVADDTTTAPLGAPMVEFMWENESNHTEWYRYSLAGKDQLPHMHMDARLSDHSKNLMYLLRAKHPDM